MKKIIIGIICMIFAAIGAAAYYDKKMNGGIEL